jgi:hypothetical protein
VREWRWSGSYSVLAGAVLFLVLRANLCGVRLVSRLFVRMSPVEGTMAAGAKKGMVPRYGFAGC